MSKKQWLFSIIPFLGSIIFIFAEVFADRKNYFEMILSLIPAMLIAFATSLAFGIVGLLSHRITLIISLIIIGIIWNMVFFNSFNNKNKKSGS